MNAPDDLTIRPFAERDSAADLTDLLHRSYASLAAMGLRFFATHQSVEQTLERIRDGACYVGEIDGCIVATIIYHAPERSGGCDWYERPDVATFGQFAVEPELQRNGYGGRLMDHVEALAASDGAAEIALDTAEPAHHLIAYYTRRGYRIVGHTQWDVTNYRSVIMSKNLAAAE